MIATAIDISHRLDPMIATAVDNSDTIDNLDRLLFNHTMKLMEIIEDLRNLRKRCEREWLDDDE